MLLKNYRITVSAVVLCLVALAFHHAFGIHPVGYLNRLLFESEHSGHSLVVPLFGLIIGILVDTIIAKRKHARQAHLQDILHQAEKRALARELEMKELTVQSEIQEQRLRVMKATMRTVHHIVNNSLNHLQLFRFDAADFVDDASVKLFDDVIQQMTNELTELANLSGTPEKESCIGVMLDCEATRTLV